MKQKYIYTFLLILSYLYSFSQIVGDFQSKFIGANIWNNAASWQTWNGSSWIDADTYPGENPGSYSVTIKTGHTITIASNLETKEMGTVIIKGELDLNPPNPYNITLSTLNLLIDGGILNFIGPQISLNLPLRPSPSPSPFIELKNSGSIGGSCTHNDEILIGNQTYAVCKSTGSSDYVTFGEITTSGETINAVITLPTTNASSCKDQPITLEGHYGGAAGSVVNYNWIITDPNGNTVTILSGTLSNNSDITTTSFTPNVFGNYLISFTVSTDISGINFSNTVTTAVVIEDVETPTLTAISNQNENVGASCSFTIPDYTALTTAADNCTAVGSIVKTQFPPVGTVINGHNTTQLITITANDGNGNTESTSFTITLKDVTPPATLVLADVNVGECAGTPTAPTTTDNCTGTITGTPNISFPITNQGATIVTWTFADGNGNSTTANQNVIVDDITKPTLTAISNKNENVGASCSFTIPNYTALTTAADNCTAMGSIVKTQSPAAGTVISGHNITQLITITANDGNGNTESTSFTITLKDVTPPIINCPGNKTANTNSDGSGNCTTTIALGTPTATDNCTTVGNFTFTAKVTGIIINPVTYLFGKGTTTVVWTATDQAGNISATCNQTVTVTDNEIPTINCPANITANTSANGTGDCYTTVNVGTPTTNDNCGVASIIARVSGITINTSIYQFPVGNTTITWTVTDNAGLTASCDQTITIVDNENPSISCPGDQNVSYNSNCQFLLQDYTLLATSSDNCDTNLTITQSPAPGTLISSAITTVTLTATDDANRTSSCTFKVIAIDNSAPTAVCKNYTAYLSTNGTINIAALNLDNGSYDNCGIANMTVSPNSFNCSNIGDNTVTFTVFDNSGNSDSCTATVTVVDNTLPTMICKNHVVVVDAITRVATIKASDIDNGSNDACGIASLSISPSVFAESPNVYYATTTLTAVDVNGNSNTCTATVTVEPPKNQFTYLTGEIVNPIPDNPQPPSALVEVTACPGGITVPKDIQFTLHAIGDYDLQASDVLNWEYSNDNGETWIIIPNTAGLLTYTLTGLTSDTFVRLKITDPNDSTLVKTSSEAYARFLPPDQPPIIVSHTALDICLNDSVTVNAESFYDQPNGQFGKGGEFNYAQPDGWRVNGLDGYFPASGDNGSETTWKETNSNSNATFSGINYDTTDNTKFAIAHGVANITTLETPVFSTIGMTSSEAILNFNTSYYFCNGGYGEIWLSFDSGNTYTVQLNTVEPYDFDSRDGLTTSGVKLAKGSGNKCIAKTNPRMIPATVNLGAYAGLSGLRVKFIFNGSTTNCGTASSSTIPNPDNVNCNNGETLASGWAIDAVGFAYAQVDDELEWTDEDGNVIATGTTATVTPVTPGIREYGVTTLVNGCRTDNSSGTNYININTSLAYSGDDYTPLASNCGESSLQLNAYDNTKTAVTNFNKGAWKNNLYVVPDITAGDTDYPGTGITGVWSIVSSSSTSCGSSATFSSTTDPDAIFTADPGSYTLRWTLTNGCYDELNITLIDCKTVDFDGTNDYVSFKNNYNLNNNFSIEVWVKPNSVNNTRTVFSRKDAGNNANGYDLSIVEGKVMFNWYNSINSGSVTTGSYTIGTDRWYHLAVTFDGSSYKLYVDGIALGSANGTAPDTTADSIEALLGAMDQANNPTNYFHGWIDELKIWNKALSAEHIRQMMNQEINASGSDISGVVIPLKIYGSDDDNNGIEDDPLSWNDLVGYYRMDVACGNLVAFKGVSGRLHNINSSEQQTAPIPYTTRVSNQTWDTDDTWTNFSVWDAPNSKGINNEPIDWNIVKTNHKVTSSTKDLTLLGLIVMSNELTITNSGAQDETNPGHGLWITHYLKLDGFIDLIGESQLLQKRYGYYDTDSNFITTQFSESIFDEASSGYIERDQQGQKNSFNYNYWSSPVSLKGSANNEVYTIANVLRDGTDSSNPKTITFGDSASFADGPLTSPIKISNRWIWAYNSLTPSSNSDWDNYYQWKYIANYTSIKAGEGYTMKGSGGIAAIDATQNYVFTGKPHSGTIPLFIAPNGTYLIGNPYPSALDADEFIKDNIKDCNSCRAAGNTFNGALYFWDHFGLSNNHILAQYEGGYATYSLMGGVVAVANQSLTVNNNTTGIKTPKRYIPVGQGFFINGYIDPKIATSVAVQGGPFNFKNNQRAFVRETSGNSLFFKLQESKKTAVSPSDDRPKITLRLVSAKGIYHQLLVGAAPNTTNEFDLGYDAPMAETEGDNIYWEFSNSKFVIQGVPNFDKNQIIPLGIKIANEGEATLQIAALENISDADKIYLYDKVTDTYYNIKEKDYILKLPVGEYTNRFSIQFDNKTISINETSLEGGIEVFFTKNNNTINIKNIFYDVMVNTVQLYNILGQSISNWNVESVEDQTKIKLPIKNNIPNGIYIIKANTTKGYVSKKIIVN